MIALVLAGCSSAPAPAPAPSSAATTPSGPVPAQGGAVTSEKCEVYSGASDDTQRSTLIVAVVLVRSAVVTPAAPGSSAEASTVVGLAQQIEPDVAAACSNAPDALLGSVVSGLMHDDPGTYLSP